MKFRKTALAVALAGMAATPFAQADVTLSGYIGLILGASDCEVQYDAAEVAGDPAVLQVDADGSTSDVCGDPVFSGDDTTINASASHTMNNGLTAYGNYRLDSALTGSVPASDNVWVGIRGGFGDIRVGEVPDASEYGQVANDALTDVGGENAGISYTGGFGPITLGVNWSPQRDSDKTAAGVKFALGGFSIGVGAADVDGLTLGSAGASFSIAGASVAVAFKTFDAYDTVGFQLGYGFAGATIGLTYEAIDGGVADSAALLPGIFDNTADGDTLVRLDIGYDLGGGMNISTRINSFTTDTGGDRDQLDYRLLIAKSF